MAASPQDFTPIRDAGSRGNNPSAEQLVREVFASSLHPRYLFTLAAMIQLAKGKRELFPGPDKLAARTGWSSWTVKRHIRKIEDFGALKKTYDANKHIPGKGFRRPPTYELNRIALVHRQWQRHQVPATIPLPPQSVKEEPPSPPPPPPPPARPAPPPPAEKPAGNGHKLPRTDRDRLTQEFVAILRGKTLYEGACFLHPESGVHQPTPDGHVACWACYSQRCEGHPPKIDPPTALTEACRRLRIPFEVGLETYKLGKLIGVYGDISAPKRDIPGGNDS